MTQPTNLYGISVGTASTVGLVPIVMTRDPASTDADLTKYPIGKEWVNSAANNVWFLTSYTSPGGVLTANWEAAGGGALELSSLTGDTGTATPSAGNIKISGTANQITTTGASHTITLTIPSAFIAPGSIAATTTVTGGTGVIATTGGVTATAGNLVATAGNLNLNGVASKVNINATVTASASVGFFTLSGSATTTLTSSAITANSIILYSLKTLGTLTQSAITYTTTGGSATITPAGSTDTSVYGYMIIN